MDIVKNLELRSYTGTKVYQKLMIETSKNRIENLKQKSQIDLTWVNPKPLGLKEPLNEINRNSSSHNIISTTDDDEDEDLR